MTFRSITRALAVIPVLVAVIMVAVVPAGSAHADSSTPVRDSATLSESEMLNWFNSRWRPEFRAGDGAVTEAELIRIYREEGNREGIAWDLAFLQAILETQWFYFPDSGQVRPHQNNFAGMGAYDNSGGSHVFEFPNVRTGVRAQMQHLRLYSDPNTNLQGSNLGSKLASDNDDRYPDRWRLVRGIKNSDGTYRYAGRVRQWEDFGNGMWATDPYYSCKILNLYRQALQYNGHSARGLPTNALCLRTWHLRFENSGGSADTHGFLGREGDHVLACDWNGDGRDTPATFNGGNWRISNQQNGGGSLITFRYGRAGDLPLCGDWSGDGRDTVGIVRDREWHLRNRLSGGEADITFIYGRVTHGDLPIVGDWNGDKVDTPGIIRDGDWHLRNTLSGGPGQIVFRYGRITQGDLPLVGDWNGDGRDSPGIVRGGDWHLRNNRNGGVADIVFRYGRVESGDVPLVGDWTGDGRSTPAIVR